MSAQSRAPLFIVGTGRCGSTIAYSCLAMHQEFAWIPSWLTTLPRMPALAAMNRFWELPGTDRFRESRFFPKPVEPNDVFAAWLKNYSTETLTDQMVEEARRTLLPLIGRIERAQGKRRFLCKMVGRPVKIALFARLYPEARFVHITRDLKPTVCSLMQVDFYQRGDSLHRWPWGVIPKAFLDYYEQVGRAEEVKGAITVQLNRHELDRQLRTVDPSRWIALAYADFVQRPIESLRRVAELADFAVDDRFIQRLESRHLYGGADQKWRTYFTESQVRNLEGFESLSGETPLAISG